MSEAKGFPLATTSWDEKEYAAIDRVVKSGIFSMGPEVKAFEEQFAAAMGSAHAVMVNSGSSANLLMVAALRYHSKIDLPAGAEVIVPAVSWSTTYYPLHQYGLRLKFVDIDADTLNYDLEALEAAIGPETRAVMVVNLLGNPNDFTRIEAVVAGRDIVVMEDNCESLGATFQGRQAGTFGIAGSYSSFFSHHIATMEGGLVVTDDEELYHIMLSVRSHGWTRNLPKFNHVTGEKSDDPFEESFKFVLPGYNLRPLEVSGAIGQEQIAKLPMIVGERRRNAEAFRGLMQGYPQIRIQQEIGQSSWFGFSMVVQPDAGFSRAELIASLVRQGVECRPVVAGNFAKNEVVTKHMDHVIHGSLKNADDIDANGLFIGNHHYPLSDQWDLLRAALDAVARS
ncbi:MULTISPECIES: DegT/DnrJ/EryC1/StrS family aminotransferase [Roseovarius]|uniref:DegT/DnrJ/EryC1/StrS family aminotransferase n=1 Tax=Roseovarius TaxID=74030 RepID=UPI001C9844EF|nr:DegT/DnrJ/EryC1/StrS family aminotransferase [Roseovarius atlanticus]MBY5986503.1 DegT/DnrJ/EryC1/StrS family aminotransferase [Roseovarius atlanticus]MBY6125143.1 DegT/DnrJ/EryC1/StrS family aminotransferase [Roseovarius atlanticus]MBY6150396.1 DegT/DnrJ/EryC1/StrS family aminotransferase [Roseovarius atlanticus]